MRGSVAFIAAPYGYGPSSKAVAISSHLPRSIHRVHLGYGPALGMARSSNAFSSCVELDFNSRPACVAKQLASYDVLVFINSTRFISAAATEGRPIILVETLAWLRDAPPPCSSLLSAYFAQRFFHHPFSPELEALDNFTVVDAILPASISPVSRLDPRPTSRPKSPLIHCGGLFSPVLVTGADQDFVARTLDATRTLNEPLRAILPEYLHSRLPPHIAGEFALLNCSPLSVHEQIIGSDFCLTTTGIEFTYESLALGVPTLFLPPFNASQAYQLAYHRWACAESIPFQANARLPAVGFPTLGGLTVSLQETGMNELWSVQFAEVSHFLDRLLTSERAPLLQAVRERQQEMLEGIASDGAHRVARHAARELGLGATPE